MSTASSLAQILPLATPQPLYEFAESPLLLRQQQQESKARSYPRRIPLALKRARGIYVEDVEGRQFIDCRHHMPRHQALSLRMIRFGKPVPTFPDHATP